jgi:5-methyltetrahydrofolate--homocysteine methyltransferase
MSEFLKRVSEGVVIYDGAMGTNIQIHAPTVDD